MSFEFYPMPVIKKLLQNNAEKGPILLVARQPSKSILASNGHWIVSLGEPALPMIYRQAYAESVPMNEQGKWQPVEGENGKIVNVEFSVDDVCGVKTLWDETRQRAKFQVEVTNLVYWPFDDDQKPERELINKGNGEVIYVAEDYLSLLWAIACNSIPEPEIFVEDTGGKTVGRVSIWAGGAMVAVLMPCEGPTMRAKG